MSDGLDPLLLNSFPADIRAVFEAQMRALVVEQGARLHLAAENADLRASVAELKALNARLEHLARELHRARFGPSSEKLSPDQLELAFEDIEMAVAEATESHDTAVV